MTEVKLWHHPDCKKINPATSTNAQGEPLCSCGLDKTILYIHRLEEENAELKIRLKNRVR
jgi:hypothetical protein